MKKIIIVLIFILTVSCIGLNFIFLKIRFFPQNYTYSHDDYIILDTIGVLCGLRRLFSNIAWIQLLQYYGASEHEHDGEIETCPYCIHEGGVYPDFLKMSQRVFRLDPFFYNSYIYSAASLAWNLNRPDEALLILKEGLDNSPYHYDFYIHKAAIIYKMHKKYEKMVEYLEMAIKQPKCPTLIKTILAGIYEKQGRYKRAVEIWYDVLLATDDAYDKERAKKKIEKLSRFLD